MRVVTEQTISQTVASSTIMGEDPPMVLNPELQFPIQSRVIFRGLQHQRLLNGHLAVVEHFLLDQGRHQVRPLSRQARLLTKSNNLAVQPLNLQLVPSSAFVAQVVTTMTTVADNGSTSTIQEEKRIRVPLECQVELDEWQEQLVVKILISDFWGRETQQKLRAELLTLLSSDMVGEDASNDDHYDNSNLLEIINTPIDYEEQISLTFDSVHLEGDEILIIPKNLFADLLDAMLDYELLVELETTIPAGLHGELPLYRLRFSYQVVYTNNNDSSPPEEQENDQSNIGIGEK